MISDINIGEYLRLGGIYKDIEGETATEVFKSICSKIDLPKELAPRVLYDALCARESILSTAVGNGIAIPHSQHPILKEDINQRIYICHLKEPIDMHAMDGLMVRTMIIPLSSSVKTHLQMISRLARLLAKSDFKKALELKLGIDEIYPLTQLD
ncbi:PTS sugar transporter subunit IIA [Treponema pectinovorum]|uniref:PTS sugar transporter subunit IIA n=1 Tax=Treponema pectinovorum TaxID=164 RepID=UPI0011C9AAD2|nr:PTS sugar transporter subunit IIA [Treponema pectinovorum]